MAQHNNTIQPNYYTLLQDVMRLIAQSSSLEQIAPIILQHTTNMMRAIGGFYVVFEEPAETFLHQLDDSHLPDADLLADIVKDLSYDVHLTSSLPDSLRTHYKGWAIAPIYHQKKIAGSFGLMFDDSIMLAEETSAQLLSFLDALTIVTSSEKVTARHNKLTQNQNEFVRIVSHDLRSPLTSIKGFASMLESAEEDPKLLHFVEKILNGVTQMTSLVDNIQDAGRYDPETGFYEMERAPTDLIDMVHKIVNTHLLPAEKGELALLVNIGEGIPIVNVDANMIERSIINLVDNAIKYTPNGGKIEVGLNRDGNNLVITVSDNGYGISKENMRQLFNRHFRIRRREHNRVKGSGLGLFIVRSVARHHDGDAFVQSVEGEGTTFGVRIPLMGANLIGGVAHS
ncbi:MAG: sensor histidine kinase [Anaerolineae bacterium]